MTRRQPGEGSVHQRPNGTWCGQVNLGVGRDGRRRRKTVYGKSQDAVIKKMGQLRRQLAEHGDLTTTDSHLSKWLTYWLTDIAADRLKPSTLRSYRTAVNEHIIPSIGTVRLGRLGTEHVRKMHRDLLSRGLSTTTAHNAHRVLAIALNDAMRETPPRVHRNVAALIPAPTKAEPDRLGLSAPVARKVIEAAEGPLAGRWLLALALGMRQGERLGLRWSHIDFERGWIDLSWSLSRAGWDHGCNPPCGKTKRTCPDKRLPIPPGMRHERLGNRNLVLLTPKTKGSRRVVAMIPPVEKALKDRLAIVASEQHTEDYDLVFCTPTGAPIDPRDDWQDWRDLLAKLKIPAVTLHEARHTAATLLLEAGIDAKVVGEILGHTVIGTTRGYQHVSLALQREALTTLAARLELSPPPATRARRPR